ncbi:hypothetical protein LTR05_005211 [Lithohypha guttulata]|uniref:Uncharacterized protein n=1 Tax=Lithohypha guttulata TaxID=1690604 RepID=A0AAN7YB18_9EURO|nr:hypothetical protein LTR05_005211 [Lithohypha guttulata]
MATAELSKLWAEHFPHKPRPSVYTSEEVDNDGFLPLADFEDFKVEDLQNLTQAQLYTLTANNAEALQLIQKEWIELERLAQHIRSRDPLPVSHKDPQQLPSREIFEERKEAALYSYKYEVNRKMLPAKFTVSENVTDQEKFDCREPPEPFAQGGFIPNDKQYKSIMAVAKAEGRTNNPDNQAPYKQNFAFSDRKEGNWIAKIQAQDTLAPPRTRAREAALNSTAGRQTRLNGERAPLSRQLSSSLLDAPSPRTRSGSPAESRSSAHLKRNIDAVDITHELPPRKKHPNQYTKRREREEAERLAVRRATITNGQSSVTEDTSGTSSPALVKKKHPNQYTKRREREELERRLREEEEEEEAESLSQRANAVDRGPQEVRAATTDVHWERPTWRSSYVPSPLPDLLPVVDFLSLETPAVTSSINRPKHPNQYTKQRDREEWASTFKSTKQNRMEPPVAERPKHPNQYTKRREQEEAARKAALAQAGSYPGHGALQNFSAGPTAAYPYQYTYPPSPWAVLRQTPIPDNRSRTAGAMPVPVSAPIASTKSRDPSQMTKEELRTHLFKDHDLLAFLEKDHSWLNEDPEKAAAWKAKIIASEYPVRTWAMLRKWKEWKAEGKDKRPRDKDGNRIRDFTSSSALNAAAPPGDAKDQASSARMEGESMDISDGDGDVIVARNYTEQSRSATPVTAAASTSEVGSTRSASPARRSNRSLRSRFGRNYLGSPGPQLRSPLVNSINARDIDTDIPLSSIRSTQARSFNTSLKAIDEVDSTTKVDDWQDKNEAQADHATSTATGRGTRQEYPRRSLRNQARTVSEQELNTESEDTASRLDNPKSANPGLAVAEKIPEPDESPDFKTINSQNFVRVSCFTPSPGKPPRRHDEWEELITLPMRQASLTSSSLEESDYEDGTYQSGIKSQPAAAAEPAKNANGTTTSTQEPPTTTTAKPIPTIVADDDADNEAISTETPPKRTTRSTSARAPPPPHIHPNPLPDTTTATNTIEVASNPNPNPITRGRRQQARLTTPSTTTSASISPVATRRAGLRPNPPKRAFTLDSESEEDDDDDGASSARATSRRRSARRAGMRRRER